MSQKFRRRRPDSGERPSNGVFNTGVERRPTAVRRTASDDCRTSSQCARPDGENGCTMQGFLKISMRGLEGQLPLG